MLKKSKDPKPKAERKQDNKEKIEEEVSEIHDESDKAKAKSKSKISADSEVNKLEKMSEENNDENRDTNIKEVDSEEETQTKKKRKTNKKEEHPINNDTQTKSKAKEKDSEMSSKVDTKPAQTSGSEKLLSREFYTRDVVTVSKELLGKIVVRKIGNTVLKCRIVETEAYGGLTDKACHSYNGRKTERTKPMYLEGGHVYVYSIHNSFCLNITTSKYGDPSAVLIRAVEIVEGYDEIVKNRAMKKLSKTGKELTNGPGKVCAAMKIDKKFNEHDLTEAGEFYIIDDKGSFEMVTTKRINVNYAEEDVDKPWRFYIKNNVYVSVKI